MRMMIAGFLDQLRDRLPGLMLWDEQRLRRRWIRRARLRTRAGATGRRLSWSRRSTRPRPGSTAGVRRCLL